MKMKELATFIGALALITTTNAANLSWDVFGVLNDGGNVSDWYTGGQAYLVLVSDAPSFNIANDLSITGGSVIQSVNVKGGEAQGTIDGGSIGAGLTHGQTYQFVVLFTTKGVAGTTLPTEGLYGVNDNDGSFYSVTWDNNDGGVFINDSTPVAVTQTIAEAPEPTSALLMLLGMAGLALKRKLT